MVSQINAKCHIILVINFILISLLLIFLKVLRISDISCNQLLFTGEMTVKCQKENTSFPFQEKEKDCDEAAGQALCHPFPFWPADKGSWQGGGERVRQEEGGEGRWAKDKDKNKETKESNKDTDQT